LQDALEMNSNEANADKQEKKVFKCLDCGKTYTLLRNLKRHTEQQHYDLAKVYQKHDKVDGKYKCMFCNKAYSHSRDLKKHYRSKHIDEVED
jgi:DNA-directed RNA polymerase subunit RPC12/RpoP